MSTAAETVGSVEAAVRNAARLLESDPKLAAEQAAEILKAVPNQPLALLLLGVARRAGGDAAGALQVLQPLAAAHPQWALAHYELALALDRTERSAAAQSALRRAVALKPDMADAWRALGDQLMAVGRCGRAPMPPTHGTSRRRPATRDLLQAPPRRCARTRFRRPRRCCARTSSNSRPMSRPSACSRKSPRGCVASTMPKRC